MFAGVRHSFFAAAVAALSLVSAPSALAEDPWEFNPFDTEGIYILEGTGPPNTRIELVEQGSSWVRAFYHDATINEGEYTSPTGQFRIDEGFCNPSADCNAGSDDRPFQLVFYRGPSVLPIWSPNTMFRVESGTFDLPEVDDVPREDRVFIDAPAPTSLPAYSTLSGTTQIIREGAAGPAPLSGVRVDAFSPGGRGSDDLNHSGAEYSARTNSLADGTWTMKVPPGTWALRYRTPFDEPFYPGYIWNSCVIAPSPLTPPSGTPPPLGVTYIGAGTTGHGLTVGEDGSCNGATPVGPGDGGDPGDNGNPGGAGASSAGGSSGGGSSGGGGGSTPAKVSAAKASSAANGTVALTVAVSGPGKLAATATGKLPGGGAKKSAAKQPTIANGSAKVKKAGTIKLVLKPTAAAKKLLKKGYKLTAKATIAFTALSGAIVKATKSVTFKLSGAS